jgi:hypothetical protein
MVGKGGSGVYVKAAETLPPQAVTMTQIQWYTVITVLTVRGGVLHKKITKCNGIQTS